jgi:hypothetical protein
MTQRNHLSGQGGRGVRSYGTSAPLPVLSTVSTADLIKDTKSWHQSNSPL